MGLLGKNLLKKMDFTSSRTHRTCVYKCGDACSKPVSNESNNSYFRDIIQGQYSRRTALRAGGAAVVTVGGASFLAACADDSGSGSTSSSAASSSETTAAEVATPEGLNFEMVAPNTKDEVVVPEGYSSDVVIRWGDPVVEGAAEFDVDKQTVEDAQKQYGFNCDFAALLPFPDEKNRFLLVSNHEYTTPQQMFPGYDADNPTEKQVNIELANHGMSIVEVEGNDKDGKLKPVMGKYNRRLHGTTEFELRGPIVGHELVKTSKDKEGKLVEGTLNNCAGGVTPWGTILSGEENVDQYFAGGENVDDEDLKKRFKRYGIEDAETARKWEKFHDRFDVTKEPNEPNRFNYIVEVNPWDPESRPVKHTALGRFKHEGANIHVTNDGTVVAYSGDDSRFEYIYKFVSSRKMRSGNSPEDREENMKILDEGTLYVATFEGNSDDFSESGELPEDGAYDGTGKWIKLVTVKEDGSAESHVDGMSAEEVIVYTRLAGDEVGATKMDRPEDVEPHPTTGNVYVALTNNKYRGANREGKNDAPIAEYAPIKENKNGLVMEIIDDHTGEDLKWNLLLVCGDPEEAETYFGGFDKDKVSPISCPDNLTFDSFGNLWVATDGNALDSNDGLFGVALEGEARGLTKQFLTVPKGAETCGPLVFEKRVLVNVQHPGEDEEATVETTESSWPDGGDSVARPSTVVAWKDDFGTIGA
ncbi:MAG TPA: PhoX family phosphatase [Candidatus Corynebacterium gallistercoris]|uniref:PhoX family phosphatase n=1 Tax=Candidatus Corynebacterium gallistercoris TaxID=2838530 RepID=A0A9D1RYX7_9CORY|nr:PhoX family phosphatase [Candidatus Corynebacterium gallistercoris]